MALSEYSDACPAVKNAFTAEKTASKIFSATQNLRRLHQKGHGDHRFEATRVYL